jgi:hypothetical protein
LAHQALSVTKICFNSIGVESLLALAWPQFLLFSVLFDEAKLSVSVIGSVQLLGQVPVRLLLAALLCLSLPTAIAAPNTSATMSTSLPVTHRAGFTDLISGKKPGLGQVWKLQQHGIVFGDIDVYLNKNGLRTECPRSGITILAQAPKFDVVAYNVRAKTIWKPTLDKFAPADVMLKSLTSIGLPSASKFPLVPSGTKAVNGLVCQTYSTTDAWTKQQIALFKGQKFSDRFPRKAEFQGVDLHVPTVIYNILEKVDGAPMIPLLPLNYGYSCLGHAKTTLVATNNCRIVDAPKDWLKVPERFKTVTSYQALNMDEAAESGIDELFGSFGR